MPRNILRLLITFFLSHEVRPFVTNVNQRSAILGARNTIIFSTPPPQNDDSENQDNSGMSFDSATQALREAEDKERMERSGNAVTEEVSGFTRSLILLHELLNQKKFST